MNKPMKMKLLDYTLVSLLAGMVPPLATAQEAPTPQTAQDRADGTAAAVDCNAQQCTGEEGLLFRLRTRSYDKPVTEGTTAQSSSAQLQPDRRVTIATETPGKAVAVSLNTRASAISAGEATITATTVVDGETVTETQTAPYGAFPAAN